MRFFERCKYHLIFGIILMWFIPSSDLYSGGWNLKNSTFLDYHTTTWFYERFPLYIAQLLKKYSDENGDFLGVSGVVYNRIIIIYFFRKYPFDTFFLCGSVVVWKYNNKKYTILKNNTLWTTLQSVKLLFWATISSEIIFHHF